MLNAWQNVEPIPPRIPLSRHHEAGQSTHRLICRVCQKTAADALGRSLGQALIVVPSRIKPSEFAARMAFWARFEVGEGKTTGRCSMARSP